MNNLNTPKEILPSTEPASSASDGHLSAVPEAPSSGAAEQVEEEPVKASATPKPPTYRIAGKVGKEIKKPLTLLGGKAYATTWQIVEKKVTETVDKDGNLIVLDPPRNYFRRTIGCRLQ